MNTFIAKIIMISNQAKAQFCRLFRLYPPMSLLLVLALASCAQQLLPLRTVGGSKADGTIVMAIEYGLFDNVKVDVAETQKKAIQTCKNWGYSNVRFFDEGYKRCLQPDPNLGCVRWREEYQAQCID